nr:DUF4157 domain-containing protein [Kofleriaceae bacterium]
MVSELSDAELARYELGVGKVSRAGRLDRLADGPAPDSADAVLALLEYLAAGAYDPGSTAGVELIAHEVAHVAQQRRAAPTSSTRVSRADDAHEQEADRFASAFVAGVAAPAVTAAPARFARKASGLEASWDDLFGEPSREVDTLARYSRGRGDGIQFKTFENSVLGPAHIGLE